MKKVKRPLITMFALIFLVLLSACQSSPTNANTDNEDLRPGDIIWGPYYPASLPPVEGDPTFREEVSADQSYARQFAEQVYGTCYAGPPALAAAASAFPSLASSCYLDTTDPVEITYLLYHNQNGGEIQQKLLAGLKELLTSSNTTLEIVYVSGMVRMTQAYVVEANGNLSVLGLSWSEPFMVLNATQLKVTHHLADGSTEIGYFDEMSNNCLSVAADAYLPD